MRLGNGCCHMSDIIKKHFIFYLLPNYSLLGFSSAVEVLRVANRKANLALYSWDLVSDEGGLFPSSAGVEMNSISMSDALSKVSSSSGFRFVICGGDGTENLTDSKTLSWVSKMTQSAESAGAISDGSYLAAKAGIFTGYKSTIHWQCYDGYVEKNPSLDITHKIFEIDRDRFSCAGGAAAYDLFLSIVQKDHGRHLSLEIAENSVVGDIRSQDSRQQLNPSFKYGASTPHLGNVIDVMEQHLEQPISLQKIAQQENITLRQLGRIFQEHVGEPPSHFYMGLRIRRAAVLLRQTTLSVDEISIACGFASSSHLAKNFKKIWFVTPREYRARNMY